MVDLVIKHTGLANKNLKGKNKATKKETAKKQNFEAENTEKNEKATVGRTLWDVLSGALPFFMKHPKTLLMILAILIGVMLVIVRKNNVEINYDKDGIHFKSSPTPMEGDSTESLSSSPKVDIDKLKKKAEENHHPYVILSITDRSQIEFECVDNQPRLINRRHITYVILALRKIKKEENLFLEQYYSSETKSPERLPGTEKEVSQTGGPWSVEFEMEAGETRTITTGAIFSYDLPLKDRLTLGEQIHLNSDEQFFSYPNAEDIVGEIVMQIESKSLNISAIGAKAARRYNKDESKLLFGDVIQQQTEGVAQTSSLSSRWLNIMPNQEIGITFKFENLNLLLTAKQKSFKTKKV